MFSNTDFLHDAASKFENQEDKRIEYRKVCTSVAKTFKDDESCMFFYATANGALRRTLTKNIDRR